MSTSETTEYSVGLCPCGEGDIIKTITTQDNPWSSADISVRINCPKCSAEWSVFYNQLILRSSQQVSDKARQELLEIERHLRSVAEPLFEEHFADFSSKKAELAELHRLGITQETYRSYLDTRKTKPSIVHCCDPLRNIAWLRQLAEQGGRLRELDALLSKHQEARNTCEQASAAIVRHKIA